MRVRDSSLQAKPTQKSLSTDRNFKAVLRECGNTPYACKYACKYAFKSVSLTTITNKKAKLQNFPNKKLSVATLNGLRRFELLITRKIE